MKIENWKKIYLQIVYGKCLLIFNSKLKRKLKKLLFLIFVPILKFKFYHRTVMLDYNFQIRKLILISLIFIFHCLFWNEEKRYLMIVSKKDMLFLNDNFNLKLFEVYILYYFLMLNLNLNLKIIWFCYLSNELTIETDVLKFHLRGCLYESGDEITSRTEQ